MTANPSQPERVSKLLLDERPLQVLPSLAKRIGLNEALIVQQLHYWLKNEKLGQVHEGSKWVYMSLEQWREEFPFWGRNTIRNVLDKLERQKIIETGNFNKLVIDRTKWYRLNYDNLWEFKRKKKNSHLPNFGKSNVQTLANGRPNFGRPLPQSPSYELNTSMPHDASASTAQGASDALGDELDKPITGNKHLDAFKEQKAIDALKGELEQLTESASDTKAGQSTVEASKNVPPAKIPPAKSKSAAKPKSVPKPHKDQALKDAIASQVQGIDPKLATSLTGTLAQKAAGVWRKKLGVVHLTLEQYEKTARSIPAFIDYFKRECEGCSVPTTPSKFEDWYTKFVTSIYKPAQQQSDGLNLDFSRMA